MQTPALELDPMRLAEDANRLAQRPLRVSPASARAELLLSLAERHHQVSFTTSEEQLDPGNAAPFLDELRQVVRQGHRLAFDVLIDPAIPAQDVRRFADAGIAEVRVRTALPVASGLTTCRLSVQHLELLRVLGEQMLPVSWCVDASNGASLAEPLGLLDLWHLPPPAGLLGESIDEKRHAAIVSWQREHIPGLLTYSRGPGFVRIVDRRRAAATGGREVLLTLAGVQAEFFEACTHTIHMDSIGRKLSSPIPSARVELLARVLQKQAVVAQGADGTLVSLPLRWRLVEFW